MKGYEVPIVFSQPASVIRAVLSATLGNALEWFNLIIYAFFAKAIAETFFPTADANVSILIVLGTFGVSYFVRPLGGVILGAYADRAGRKAALLASIILMMLGTFLIAITPGYSLIGVAAPAIVIVARLLQGFSAGGEFASSTAFLAEQSPDRRAFYSSWQFASTGFSVLLGSAFGGGLSLLLTAHQVMDWGWRIPFFFGLLIGPVGIHIRRHVKETPEFRASENLTDPLATALRQHMPNMFVAFGAVILATVSMYMILYMPTYAVNHLKLTTVDGFRASLVAGLIVFVFTPLSGLLADRVGSHRIAIIMATLLFVEAIPLFYWVATAPSAVALVVVQVALGLPTSGYLGVLPVLLIELFPVQIRSSAMSLSYNVSVMTFGGFAPLVINWLISAKGWLAAPGYYLTLAAGLSSAAVFAVSFKNGRLLRPLPITSNAAKCDGA